MFWAPFHAYVYRIYGASFCLNVTSESENAGTAVLIRALEPLAGLELMQDRRGITLPKNLCRGPGRLCQALGIDLSFNGVDLVGDETLWLAPLRKPRRSVGASPRIGISKAVDAPLRFYESGSTFLSGPRRLSPDVSLRA